MHRMSSRKAKHYVKRWIRKGRLVVVKKVGRLYLVDRFSSNFHCFRYYGWCVAREDHPAVEKLKIEHTAPLKRHHSLWGYPTTGG